MHLKVKSRVETPRHLELCLTLQCIRRPSAIGRASLFSSPTPSEAPGTYCRISTHDYVIPLPVLPVFSLLAGQGSSRGRMRIAFDGCVTYDYGRDGHDYFDQPGGAGDPNATNPETFQLAAQPH